MSLKKSGWSSAQTHNCKARQPVTDGWWMVVRYRPRQFSVVLLCCVFAVGTVAAARSVPESTFPRAIMIFAADEDKDRQQVQQLGRILRTRLNFQGVDTDRRWSPRRLRNDFQKAYNDAKNVQETGDFLCYFHGEILPTESGLAACLRGNAANASEWILISDFWNKMVELRSLGWRSASVILDVDSEVAAADVRQELRSIIGTPEATAELPYMVIALRNSEVAESLPSIAESIGDALLLGAPGSGPRVGRPTQLVATDFERYLVEHLKTPTAIAPVEIITSAEVVMGDAGAEVVKGDAGVQLVVEQRPREPQELIQDLAVQILEQRALWPDLSRLIIPVFWDRDRKSPATDTFSTRLRHALIESLGREAGGRVVVLGDRDLPSDVVSGSRAEAWKQAAHVEPEKQVFADICDHLDVPTETIGLVQVSLRNTTLSDFAEESSGPGTFSVAEVGVNVRVIAPGQGRVERSGRAVVTPEERCEIGGRNYLPPVSERPVVGTGENQELILPNPPPMPDANGLADRELVQRREEEIRRQQKWMDTQPPTQLSNLDGEPLRLRLRRKGSFSDLPINVLGDGTTSVQLRKGDVFEIIVYQEESVPLFMSLFVDGLSTLPRAIVRSDGTKSWKVAPADAPDKARWWFLRGSGRSPHRVSGFVTSLSGIAGDHDVYDFRVTDAENSEAAKAGISMSNVGTITAHFYYAQQVENSGTMSLGTEFGNQKKVSLTYENGYTHVLSENGSLQTRGTLQLRYEE